jgi:precorrin-4 methylase
LFFLPLLAGSVLLLILCGPSASAARADGGEGKFYLIGTGPAGPRHATLAALDSIQRADFVLCPDSIRKRFAKYLENKNIMETDPFDAMFSYQGKSFREILASDPETIRAFHRHRIQRRDQIVRRIKEKIRNGKRVALLTSGDPCLFGPGHWFLEGFAASEVEVIPGVGAFSAAMAALKKSSIPAYDARFVVQTAPFFLFGTDPGGSQEPNPAILNDISRYPGTLAFYMALRNFEKLVEKLRSRYPADLPVAVVYYAGYAEKEEIIRGNLSNILEKIQKGDEDWLGMVIAGRCLEGRPYRTRAEQMTNRKTPERAGGSRSQ